LRKAAPLPLQKFLASAHELFGLHSKEHNEHYIDVPARLGRNRLPAGTFEHVNPILFLTGIHAGRVTPYAAQKLAPAPSVSLIVGQYGLGKTELIFRVCEQMRLSTEKVLPVNLALCRDDAGIALLDGEPSSEAVSTLLFDRIFKRAGLDRDGVLPALLSDIRNGRILLILDGLDELVSNQTQHNHFFAGLMRLLEGAEARFRVIVSMRFEYLSLSGVAADDASDLAALIQRHGTAGKDVAVFFLVLDYLGDSGVEDYLDDRLDDGARVYADIRGYSRVLEMLRRPLLLRIFCDVAPNVDLPDLLAKLGHRGNPVPLLKAFTKAASSDKALAKAQDDIAEFTWDIEALARQSLDLYRHSQSELTVRAIRSVLRPIEGESSVEEIVTLPVEEVLKGVHKCPFLKLDSAVVHSEDQKVARFAHRIFFEYFTARAMAAELQDRSAVVGKRAFDELVLNVDMRKFLRGLVEDDVTWYKETRPSYGLDNPEEWEDAKGTLFDVLEQKRRILLDAMTDPENPEYYKESPLKRNTMETVHWFVQRQAGPGLHPGYLTYNYESVAVYLTYQRNPGLEDLRKRFDRSLHDRLLAVLAILGHDEPKLQTANSLLLERVLDIGRRLRFVWAKDFVGRTPLESLRPLFAQDDADVFARVTKIFVDTNNTAF
jgi:hypothetical protein